MKYKLSAVEFKNGKMFDANDRFSHKPANRIKLFPYITSNNLIITDLQPLVGAFLCRIEESKPVKKSLEELVDDLKENTEVQTEDEERFREIIKQLFFLPDETIRDLNIEFIKQRSCDDVNENKMVEYFVDVLGDKSVLSASLNSAKAKIQSTSNVLEALMLKKFEYEEDKDTADRLPYFRVTESLHNVFEEDFKYILDNPQLVRQYLTLLLEFYYFSYSAQTCLQLDRLLDGERDKIIPLFFSIEWEKTSQNRQCFTEGWQKLQRCIRRIFAHAVVLEMLNYTEKESAVVDYIAIESIIDKDKDQDQIIGSEIEEITRIYRENIRDCPEMLELKKEDDIKGKTATELKYLFDNVRIQFENVRSGPYSKYANKLEGFCTKFLKSRGRSGQMLNLSEETLIFLTRLSIKGKKQLRLKEVFEEFERRGIYLDSTSKEQVADYYEKLNLIEKKSDSGDAKYVKRIL